MPFINGIGPGELIIILIIALIVVGPGKLPDVGASLGKSIREFRKAATDVKESTSLEPTPAQAPAPQAPTQAAPVAVAAAPVAVAAAPVVAAEAAAVEPGPAAATDPTPVASPAVESAPADGQPAPTA
jgi:TatA/E family protein of Tat protein translocase